jgi:hypothetical protein
MSPLAIALLAFALALAGIVAGSLVQRIMPDSHLNPDAKEVVKLSMGVVGTLAALVLGLLVASAKSSYDARESEVKQLAAYVILLDTLLAQYGEEAEPSRVSLRRAIPPVADRIWREAQSETLQAAPFKAASQGEAFYRSVQALKPTNEVQSDLKTRIVQVTTDLAQARFLLFSHLGSAIQVPFLAVLLFWMTIMFAGFALLAPANTTTLAALVVCALSVSGAVFLILELDHPFSGVMAIRSESLRGVLAPIGP